MFSLGYVLCDVCIIETWNTPVTKGDSAQLGYLDKICNIRPNITQRRSVEKVPINDWQASVTLILLVFHRLDLAS